MSSSSTPPAPYLSPPHTRSVTTCHTSAHHCAFSRSCTPPARKLYPTRPPAANTCRACPLPHSAPLCPCQAGQACSSVPQLCPSALPQDLSPALLLFSAPLFHSFPTASQFHISVLLTQHNTKSNSINYKANELTHCGAPPRALAVASPIVFPRQPASLAQHEQRCYGRGSDAGARHHPATNKQTNRHYSHRLASTAGQKGGSEQRTGLCCAQRKPTGQRR